MALKKSIYDYDNYREFLKDSYASEKAKNRNFSFRVFSRMAGIKAENYLKLVMDGQRNLTLASIEKFAKGLKLGKAEGEFFKNLVLFNQAPNVEERSARAEELLRSRTLRKMHPLKEYQYNYLANWYFVPVREMVKLRDFKEDPAWIASHVLPNITPLEAAKALTELQALGLLTRNKQGRLVQNSPAVGTPDEVVSSAAGQFHREMLQRAIESIDRFPREKRDLGSMTFSVSLESAKKLKEIIQEFRKTVIGLVTQEAQERDRIYQLGMYLFPLVDEVEKEK